MIEITQCLSDLDRIRFLTQAEKPLGDILLTSYIYLPNLKYLERLGASSFMKERHLITMFSNGRIGITYVIGRRLSG